MSCHKALLQCSLLTNILRLVWTVRKNFIMDATNTTVPEAMTESKTAQELHWTLAFLEALADSYVDGLLVVDLQGRRLLQNPLMSTLWKIPHFIAEDPDYQKQLQYVATRTRNPQQFLEKVTYLYAHPEESSRDEIELVDGTVLDRTSTPVIGRDGTCYGRAWTFRDITYRKRAARELDEQAAVLASRLRALWAIMERE